MAQQTQQTLTPEQMKAKIALLEAQLAEKNSRKISIGISDYGKGAVMITGFGRWPISLFGPHIKAILDDKTMEKAYKYFSDNKDLFRAAAYAAEYCEKAGLKFVQGAKNEAFKTAYDAAKAQALADSSLMSSQWAKQEG